MWVCERGGDIPGAARTFLDLADGASPQVGMVRTGTTVASVKCESLDHDISLALARRLAPMLDAGAPVDDDSDLPRAVAGDVPSRSGGQRRPGGGAHTMA